jgi:ABC-type nitrate/sulfonate/bicarbonate transport system substrate-binding protein
MSRAFIRCLAMDAFGLAILGTAVPASAQSPRADGETVKIHHFKGSMGNMHAFVAARKGFCEKYNFHCELVSIPSALTAVQAVVGGSLDIAQGGIEMTASAINAGSDLVIAGVSLPRAVLFVAARSDVPLPHKAEGYPAVMADLKGRTIGVPARGAAGEVYLNVMMREAGVDPKDVTVIGVGGPQTAYTSMVVGKQIDAAVTFSPAAELCAATEACDVIVDMRKGEGPKLFNEEAASGVMFVTRREFADGNPELMAAFYAAMKDAAAWMQDPANLDELVSMYKSSLTVKGVPDPDRLVHDWIGNSVSKYSTDLHVNRDGIKTAIDFAVAHKMLDKPVDVSKIVWDKAP